MSYGGKRKTPNRATANPRILGEESEGCLDGIPHRRPGEGGVDGRHPGAKSWSLDKNLKKAGARRRPRVVQLSDVGGPQGLREQHLS